MGPTDPVGVESIILERLRYGYHYRLGPAVLASISVERMDDIVHNEMMLKLEAELLAEKIETQDIKRSVVVQMHKDIPDGRVQRWKARHWTVWWGRALSLWIKPRFIRVEENHEVTLAVLAKDYATFPYSAFVPAPQQFGPVVFKRMTEAHIDSEKA